MNSGNKVAIMQPYLFPYIGYWQLINAVDIFVIYDNIQYTKKGWFNRNRILMNGKDMLFSLPLKKDSDYLDVHERYLSESAGQAIKKLEAQIQAAYRKAPFFDEIFPLIKECLHYDEKNLFKYIYHSIELINDYVGIDTNIIVSSGINIDHDLKSDKKVLSICKEMKSDIYINPIGGLDLYDKSIFSDHGIELFFIKSREIIYPQLTNEFIPSLSIIDVLMFNSKDKVKKYLDEYDLV